MRRLANRCLASAVRRSPAVRITNVFEPLSAPELSEAKEGQPLWMRFFTERGSAQIDLDRSLINREDDMDEFSRRFIIKNYTQFSTYQLLRSIYFLSRSSDKFQFLWELKKRIAEGDWKIEADDAVLLAKDLKDLIQADELLTEFALYQIASNFDQMDITSMFYALEFQLNNCKLSSVNIKKFQSELAAINGPGQLEEFFKAKPVEEQLLMIQIFATLERIGIQNPISQSTLIDIVEH